MPESIFNGQCARECIHSPWTPRGLAVDPETDVENWDAAINPDGSLGYVSYGECGLRARFISSGDMDKIAPHLRQLMEDCKGRTIKEVKVPRRILGRFGMTKAVQVTECGAVSRKELFEIAMAEREGRL